MALTLLFGLVVSAGAQSSRSLQLQYQRIEAGGFPRIVSFVAVYNDSGYTVGGLDSSHFVVREDGVREYPIEVVEITDDSAAVTAVLVIDRSSSMRHDNAMQEARDASATFINLLGDNDRAGIVSFASTVRVDHPISTDKVALTNAVQRLEASGGTALYDGMIRGADLLQQQNYPAPAMIVLTDGDNKEDSRATFQQALDAAVALNAPVFTIALKYRGSFIEQNLIDLAAATGGRYFYSPTAADLEAIYRAILDLLHHRYRVTYNTHNPTPDGTLRRVRIDVNAFATTSFDTAHYRAPFEAVMVCPATNDLPVPGRTFTLDVVIPDSSRPVYELKNLDFALRFDPQYLRLDQPLAQAISAGSLFDSGSTFSYNVDAAGGIVRFRLSRISGAGYVNGRGQIARLRFTCADDLPDNFPLRFAVDSLVAVNRDDYLIPAEPTALTVYSYGYVTLAPATTGILQPGRTIAIDVMIPPDSKSVPALQDIAFTVDFGGRWLQLAAAPEGAVSPGELFAPVATTQMQAQSRPDSGQVRIALAKRTGAAVAQGRGTLATLQLAASLEMPDSTAITIRLREVAGRDDSGWPVPFRTRDLTIISEGLIVWPGDTDHNGVVDLADVLPLGLFWGLQGPGRPDENDPLLWKAQLTRRYPVRPSTHSDADGSGAIDERDILPVGLNWGKSRTTTGAAAKVAATPPPSLRLALLPDAAPGQYRVQLISDASVLQPLQGVSCQLALPGGVQVLRAEPGDIWPASPLFIAKSHGAGSYGAGLIVPAGNEPATSSGTALELWLQSAEELVAGSISVTDLVVVSPDGRLHEVDVAASDATSPQAFQLLPAYPNPFNPSTTVRYEVPAPGQVELTIFAATGQQVVSKTLQHLRAGSFDWQWQAKDSRGQAVSSGVYFLRLRWRSNTGEFRTAQQKLVYVR